MSRGESQASLVRAAELKQVKPLSALQRQKLLCHQVARSGSQTNRRVRGRRQTKPRGSWCAHLLTLTAYYLVRRSRCSAPETRLGRQDRGGVAKQWRALLRFPNAVRSKKWSQNSIVTFFPLGLPKGKNSSVCSAFRIRSYTCLMPHASCPCPCPAGERGSSLPGTQDHMVTGSASSKPFLSSALYSIRK